jgi:hypothetical protein
MKKYSDNYKSKLDIWAKDPEVCSLPKVSGLPEFSVKRFNSYAEMNAWKKDYLEKIAAQGGVTWTK